MYWKYIIVKRIQKTYQFIVDCLGFFLG